MTGLGRLSFRPPPLPPRVALWQTRLCDTFEGSDGLLLSPPLAKRLALSTLGDVKTDEL
jgi:hypothetical protein